MNKIYKICSILLISIISFLYIFIFAIKKNNTNLDLFCQFINSVFQLADDIINIVKVNITGISFDMFTYKRNDAVSTQITKRGYWELSDTNK